MRRPLHRLALPAIAPALLVAGGGPVGPIVGGRLCETVVTTPVADWSFAAPARRLQLETRPEHPHSMNVGFAVAAGLHVAAILVTCCRSASIPERDDRSQEPERPRMRELAGA